MLPCWVHSVPPRQRRAAPRRPRTRRCGVPLKPSTPTRPRMGGRARWARGLGSLRRLRSWRRAGRRRRPGSPWGALPWGLCPQQRLSKASGQGRPALYLAPQQAAPPRAQKQRRLWRLRQPVNRRRLSPRGPPAAVPLQAARRRGAPPRAPQRRRPAALALSTAPGAGRPVPRERRRRRRRRRGRRRRGGVGRAPARGGHRCRVGARHPRRRAGPG